MRLCAYLYRNTRTKQNNPPTCTDSFASGYFGHVPYTLYQHVAEVVQWCVRKCISPLLPAHESAAYESVFIPIYLSQYFELSNTAMIPTTAFWPPSRAELKNAVDACFEQSSRGDCFEGGRLGPIGKWDVSQVTDMSRMFSYNDERSGDIFRYTNSFNANISNWDVSSVIHMPSMLAFTSFTGDLSKWDVSSVKDMSNMFEAAQSFNGDISKWDVSNVIAMPGMFRLAASFNGDISKWDVSSVTDTRQMFLQAESFNGDISKWDVSRVISMDYMFVDASSFMRILCEHDWVLSKASKLGMFSGCPGSISRTVCTSVTTQGTSHNKNSHTQNTHPKYTKIPERMVNQQYVQRRPVPDRELIARTPASTPGLTSTCPKCGTFQKSGRVSCCAPGGAWFKSCGGVVNKNVDHRWSEGVKLCKGKFEAIQWHAYAD